MGEPPVAPVRLVGGPYHGDEGLHATPLPGEIWVATCNNPRCPYGKVHWIAEAMEDRECERYLKAGKSKGVQLYIHSDPADEPDLAAIEEEALVA